MNTHELLDAVRSGRARAEWGTLTLEHAGHSLEVSVLKDALKFDDVPPMSWKRTPKPGSERYDGVRLPATPIELQMIADMCYGMLMTPKVVDQLWVAAGKGGAQIESIVNIRGTRVASVDVHEVHLRIEDAVEKAGGPKDGFVEAVGKYWVACKSLAAGKRFGKRQAINYGWPTRGKGNGLGVGRTHNVWQTIGGAHNDVHADPSQTIRFMHRLARLRRAGHVAWEFVDLYDLLKDPVLAFLVSHEGPLTLARQASVPEPQPVKSAEGVYVMPETVVFGGATV